jgi:fimbrial chaperone protein
MTGARALLGGRWRAGWLAAPMAAAKLQISAVYRQPKVYPQDGGAGLTPPQDGRASPPIIPIGPNSSQSMRRVRRSERLPTSELRYRILIDAMAKDDGPASGVDIGLRSAVPMLVLAADERSVYQREGGLDVASAQQRRPARTDQISILLDIWKEKNRPKRAVFHRGK